MHNPRLILLSLLASLFSATAAEKPNVVVIYIDDMGYADPSCFGNPLIKTPNIDSIAEGGLKLTNYYSNSPICSASRTALATGQYQQRWRMHTFLSSRKNQEKGHMANWLDPKAIHTAQVFKSAGYSTAHFGKWHMGGGRDVGDAPLPTEYGFDESLVSFEGLGDRVLFGEGEAQSRKLGRGKIQHAEKAEVTGIYTDRSIDFIDRNKDKPFYLELFPNDVHDKFFPSKGGAEKFATITNNPEERKFLAVLAELDRQIGRLLTHLEKTGLADNTILIFTSDNGPTDWASYYKRGIVPPGFTGQFSGRKWSLYEGGIRLPFIARWPGHIPAGETDDSSVVAAFDLQRTLAQMAGIPTPESKEYDGLDRSKVLLGEPSNRSEPIFWEYGSFGTIKPGRKENVSPYLAMRDGDWKILCQPDGSDAQLFNLKDDPSEKSDLTNNNPERAEEMKSSLTGWWKDLKAASYP